MSIFNFVKEEWDMSFVDTVKFLGICLICACAYLYLEMYDNYKKVTG
jgi:hypothetical protein